MKEDHAEFSGEKNPLTKWLKDPENKIKYRNLHKNSWDKRKLDKKKWKKLCDDRSKMVSKAILEDRLIPFSYNIKGYVSSIWGKLFYQSSYERRFIEICEKNINIKQVIRCNFCIYYYVDKKRHRYHPDFIIIYKNDSKEIVEIKPKSLQILL